MHAYYNLWFISPETAFTLQAVPPQLDAILRHPGTHMQLSDDFDINIFRENGTCTA